MTKQEQNEIIERVWTEHLQRKDSIPADLANKYSIWLRGVIKRASALLVSDSAPQSNEAESAQPQQNVKQGA